MDAGYQPARFEMIGVGAEDPLGLWTTLPQDTVHFGVAPEAGDDRPADTPIYRIQLPENFATAQTAFTAREVRIEQSTQILGLIPHRLDELTTDRKVINSKATHFGVDDVGTPETELLNLIADVDANGTVMIRADGQVDFGVLDESMNPVVEQAKSQFNALLDQIDREVLHFAWVETAMLGQTLARTSVDWSGDAETVWMEGISSEQSSLHTRALRFATRSRALKMRMAVTVAGGAAKMAALMTNPAGAVLALPVVYRYVRQMLEQASNLKELKESVPNPSA